MDKQLEKTLRTALGIFKNNFKALDNRSVNSRLSPAEKASIPKLKTMYTNIIKDIEKQL